MTETIPGPRKVPLLGNILELNDGSGSLIGSFERLADAYGPIYQVGIGGTRRLLISSADLLEEMTDEKRFVKVPPILRKTAAESAKGLFTATNEDPDWAQGHRILMPAFAPLSIHEMFPDMKDIANQLILSWARKGPENRILVTDDFTKLTLDTIALCTMSYRFNSFYTDSLNPFVKAMMATFEINNDLATKPAFVRKLMFKKDAEVENHYAIKNRVGLDIVEHRRANPTDKKDVLNTMIYGKDPKTGQVMRDDLIVAQMTTFLIAGHETTSGLLSFAMANMLKNPHTYLKAQQEIDEVIGSRAIEVPDIKNLKYLNAVLRETARLTPTVPLLQKHVNPEAAKNIVTVLGGRFQIKPDDHILILVGKCQRDPKVWGETADEFIPERMFDENFDEIMAAYPGAWKPFGNGKRACIGRPFAWQESMLVLAMVLQSFDVKLDDPNYTLKIKQSLTIKPNDLYIRVTPRKQLDATGVDRLIHSGANGTGTAGLVDRTKSSTNRSAPSATSAMKPMTILYGSNTGTCQAFAQQLSSQAACRGFHAKVKDLDSATGSVPKGHPLIIITSSYEGLPPENAARFIEWLQGVRDESLADVEYTVFGCGHRDWSRTFHRIPKLADELLCKHGAKRIAPVGFADAAKGNLQGEFEDWLDASFWPNLSHEGAESTQQEDSGMQVEVSTNARASSLRYDVGLARVTDNRLLTQPGEPAKWHMDIELPSGATYECGDYLAVLPLNSEKNVKRIMAHFGLPWDAVITVKSTGSSIIPTDTPLSVFDVLKSYVELNQVSTKKNLRTLALYTESTTDKEFLENLASDGARFENEILTKRTSIFDILSHHSTINLPFGEFLALLPPLRVRQYSISSSPLAREGMCSITYGVIDAARFSDPEVRFEGVTGNYLSSLTAGDSIQASVRPGAKKSFRLPLDPGTSIIMFAAGTGIAPFRGFIQQRYIMQKSNPGRKLGRAIFYLGCRGEGDRLYAEEMDAWIASGVVDVRYAFSRGGERSRGCKYVADCMVREGDASDIVALWRGGARVYMCGSGAFRDTVRDAATVIAKRQAEKEGLQLQNGTDGEMGPVEKRFRDALTERVASDVFD